MASPVSRRPRRATSPLSRYGQPRPAVSMPRLFSNNYPLHSRRLFGSHKHLASWLLPFQEIPSNAHWHFKCLVNRSWSKGWFFKGFEIDCYIWSVLESGNWKGHLPFLSVPRQAPAALLRSSKLQETRMRGLQGGTDRWTDTGFPAPALPQTGGPARPRAFLVSSLALLGHWTLFYY